jgi:hypothetical protein
MDVLEDIKIARRNGIREAGIEGKMGHRKERGERAREHIG